MAKQSKSNGKPLTPAQAGTLDALRIAWTAEHDAETKHVGGLSADTIRRILECQKSGLGREQIAVGLGFTTSGPLARHFSVARVADKSLSIVGLDGEEREYPSALAALDSGRESLRTVYQAVAPSRTSKRGGKTARSIQAAIESLFTVKGSKGSKDRRERTVQYKDGKQTLTLRPISNYADFLATVGWLFAQPVAGLDQATRETLIDSIPAPAPAAAPAADTSGK